MAETRKDIDLKKNDVEIRPFPVAVKALQKQGKALQYAYYDCHNHHVTRILIYEISFETYLQPYFSSIGSYGYEVHRPNCSCNT